MNSTSSSTPASAASNRRHPQQYYRSLSERDQRSILRQTPPSAYSSDFRTPSHHGRSLHSRRSIMDDDDDDGDHIQEQHQQFHIYHNAHHRHYQQFDSPFASPPPTIHQHQRNHWNVNNRPAPLILDPQRPTPPPQPSSVSSFAEKQPKGSRSTSKVVHKLFEAAKRGMRDNDSMNNNKAVDHHSGGNSTQNRTNDSFEYTESAVLLARSACHAGYLQKMGANIPELKRRFFVLKPESSLYYYLSPNDKEPRGKIDLEGSRIDDDDIEHLPDGRYRFKVVWDQPFQRRMVLEARSKEIGEEWINYIREERVSTLKEKVENLSTETTTQKQQIADMAKQIANYKLIEKDRDDAIEDAKNWKEQFHRLDEALRLLTQRVRKPPPSFTTSMQMDKPLLGDVNDIEEEKKEPYPQEDSNATPNRNNSEEGGDDTLDGGGDPSALLDGLMEEQQNVEEIMDVPGTYFSALSNACQQQRESLRLAAIEASTAVDDVHAANQELESSKKRMEKAEKHLTKIWEENCTLRKTLKQRKREKRVLVREVKALQEATKEMQEDNIIAQENARRLWSRSGATGGGDEAGQMIMEDTLIGSEAEEKLINELEEHVASSIRLHEKLLSNTAVDYDDDGADTDLNTSVDESETLTNKTHFLHTTAPRGATNKAKMGSDSATDNGTGNSPLQPTALQTKLYSLVDDVEESESDSDDEESDGEAGVNEYESIAPSISSVGAEMGDPIDGREVFAPIDAVPSSVYSDASSPERVNPLLELKDDSQHDKFTNESTIKLKSAVTESGQATSRLVCPLADVVETPKNLNDDEQPRGDLQVYHVTFYSQKIGLQFQKAPPAPSKPKGILTDVIAADLAGAPNGSRTTAAQLRSIAEISSIATTGRKLPEDQFCPVALPVDIVLVCGFEGFDDSGMNQKPDLGARLVAFNGVSVEIGQWTFDAIRKAIKSCGRPLTLSFRNDFLTSEQRTVLTRAVMEVEVKCPIPRPIMQYGQKERPPSTTPSINSALSHETDQFVNDGDNGSVYSRDDEYSTSNSSTGWNRPPTMGNSSYHSERRHRSTCSSNNSVSTRRSDHRSFSEAGTSSVLSTAIAPLVANLMKGVSERKEKSFTPVYLQERGETLKNTPQHLDFQSNLL